MNERIRELSKQAGDYANEIYLAPVRSKTPDKIWEEGHITWDHIFQAKFAELIVRECSQISKDYQRNYYESHGARIAKKIKQHFGVEE